MVNAIGILLFLSVLCFIGYVLSLHFGVYKLLNKETDNKTCDGERKNIVKYVHMTVVFASIASLLSIVASIIGISKIC